MSLGRDLGNAPLMGPATEEAQQEEPRPRSRSKCGQWQTKRKPARPGVDVLVAGNTTPIKIHVPLRVGYYGLDICRKMINYMNTGLALMVGDLARFRLYLLMDRLNEQWHVM